jgi:hypothetical protein
VEIPKTLFSNSTGAEGTESAESIQSFDSQMVLLLELIEELVVIVQVTVWLLGTG